MHQKPNSNIEKLWVWEGEDGTVEFKKQEKKLEDFEFIISSYNMLALGQLLW